MDFKLLKKAVSEKAKKKRKRFKGVAKSYVSLFLVAVLIAGSTTAWFTAKNSQVIESQTLKMTGANGMQEEQLQAKQTEVVIQNFRLEEASSIDGRNIYFPASFTDNVSDATSATVQTQKSSTSSDTLVNWSVTNNNLKTQTLNMRYREGNAGDKNVRYAYASTDINSNGSRTNVWIKGYKIKIGDDVYEDKPHINYDSSGAPTTQEFPDPYSCPVRIAIIDDSGHKPKVFDPSAQVQDYAANTYAIRTINSKGKPTQVDLTQLDSFSSYYYGTDNPLFTIDAGKTVNLTVVAWLEGTHPYAKNYSGRQMTVEIEIETNVTQMEEVYLHDWTIGDQHNNINSGNYKTAQTWDGAHWLTGDVNIVMSYKDTKSGSYKSVVMTKQGTNDSNGCTVYKAAIPKYVNTDISFYRLSKSTDDVFPGTVFNSWHTYSGVRNAMNSSIKNSGWEVLGNIAETRKIGSTNNTYTHYYAIRGNGYSTVAHNATDRYQKWLSPCIGYWGTTSGPVSR